MPVRLRLQELLPVLKWLDQLLERAISGAQIAYGSGGDADPYPGLHVTLEEIDKLLGRPPGDPPFPIERAIDGESLSTLIGTTSPFSFLQQTFSLTGFDLEVVAIALAPEIDRRYERLYAYLQDDMTCRRPTVDLALNLLCDSGAAKLMQRHRFAASSPLLHNDLIHLLPDPNQAHSSLLAHSLVVDEQIIALLLGQPGLDARLASYCQWVQPALALSDLLLDSEVKQALAALAIRHWRKRPLRLYFKGDDWGTKRRTAEAVSKEIGAPLLVVNLGRLTDLQKVEPTLRLVFREASFQHAVLYIHNLDDWQGSDHRIAFECLLDAILDHPGFVILAGEKPWIPAERAGLGMIPIKFGILEFSLRKLCWSTHLQAAGLSLDPGELNTLVDCFNLTPDQIADTVTSATHMAQWQGAAASTKPRSQKKATDIPPTLVDLYAAARAQSGQDLRSLATRIEPKHSLDDLVLPYHARQQLAEICHHVQFRAVVHRDWGFEHKLSLGKGLNVLFHGPPGTGKTMASEALAHALQLDLYKIDLSQVVSKYIGETEKSLNRIFTAAQNANAILLFDEADALLGKRSEVKDAHDRYANLEVAYLLQKMEEYEGITILTTNLRQNLDDAFTRRIRFILEFPFPKEESRLLIWQGMWPENTPMSSDVDFQLMAEKFELAGGSIRNIALSAAFLAAAEDGEVGMNHLLLSTKREIQKMGRLINEVEFSGYQKQAHAQSDP